MLTQPYRDDGAQPMPDEVYRALGQYMGGVYALMAAGLTVSAGAAALVFHDARLTAALFSANGPTVLGWIVLLAPLGLVVTISAGADRIAPQVAWALFVLYALLVGLSLGTVGYAFTGASISGTLVATAVGFAALGAWGSTTRRDLSALGAFFGIGLIGIVLMMVINLWVRSERLDLSLAAAAIVTFAALTAFDVQRLKRMYLAGEMRSTVVGALTLYLDFLNIFLSLLRFTGRRR